MSFLQGHDEHQAHPLTLGCRPVPCPGTGVRQFVTCQAILNAWNSTIVSPSSPSQWQCIQLLTQSNLHSEGDPLHIMVATGNAFGSLDDVEVINLGGGLEAADLYIALFQESFLLSNGSWLIVGGAGLLPARTSDIYSNGVMTGGPGKDRLKNLRENMVYMFVSFTDLPYSFDLPNGTLINSSHIFLSGVRGKYERAYLANVDTWEFTWMPDMPDEKHSFSCGMVEKEVSLKVHAELNALDFSKWLLLAVIAVYLF